MNHLDAIRTLTAVMFSFAFAATVAYADSQPVRVTNTNANPVPVNGNVVVSGTANVNVTNPVTIGNTAPIPVTITGAAPIEENPARSAVNYFLNANTVFGVYGIQTLDTSFIPTGSRFVMETANVQCEADAQGFPVQVMLTTWLGANPQRFTIPLLYQGGSQGTEFYVGHLNGAIYMDPSPSYYPSTLAIRQSSTTAGSNCWLLLSGHLVKL